MLLSAPECAPVVAAGSFDIGVWYTSNVPAWLIVEGLDVSGSWTALGSAVQFPGVRSWARASRRVVVAPGFTAVRFGMALRSTGQLVTDDYTILPATV